MTARNKRLLDTYSITEKQWNETFKLQKGVCPICLKEIFKPGNKEGKATAHVDHDHSKKGPTKGRVRGLLCWFCNRRRVSNNTVEHAKRMVDYLGSDFDARLL